MKKVLVVDDNAVNRKLACAMMRKRGWEAAEADCGLSGLASLDAAAYDAVLLDISMPGMNGDEVCRQIRANDKTRHLRVIAYTAHAMECDREQIMSAGFDDILIKPVTMEMLKSKLPD